MTVREQNDNTHRLLRSKGAQNESDAIRILVGKPRTAKQLLDAITAFQGGGHDAANKSRAGYLQVAAIAAGNVAVPIVGAINAAALTVAISGWKDTVDVTSLQLDTLGRLTDPLKQTLAANPNAQVPVGSEVMNEAEQRMLGYSLYRVNTVAIIELALGNVVAAGNPGVVVDVVKTTLKNAGEVVGWVLRAAFEAVGEAVPPLLGGLGAAPWWVWLIGGGLAFLYLRPLLPFRR